MIITMNDYNNLCNGNSYFMDKQYEKDLTKVSNFGPLAGNPKQAVLISRPAPYYDPTGVVLTNVTLIKPIPKKQESIYGTAVNLFSVRDDARFAMVNWLLVDTGTTIAIPQLFYRLYIPKVLPMEARRTVTTGKKYIGVYENENGKFYADVLPDIEFNLPVEAALARNHKIDLDRNSPGYSEQRRKNKIDPSDINASINTDLDWIRYIK